MFLLHIEKLICSNVILFNDEVKNLRRMFLQNSYPNYFFKLILKKFQNNAKQKPKTNDQELFVQS